MTESTKDAAPALQRAGYRHGLRQPSIARALRIELPVAIDYAHVDAWLEQSFDSPVAPLAEDAAPHREVRAFAWRMLHLGNALLRGIKVGAFSPGRIVSAVPVAQAARTWDVVVEAPQVDQAPGGLVRAAYQTAAKALVSMAASARTPEAVGKLFDALESAFVKPYQMVLGGGESTMPMLKAAYGMDIPFRHLSAGIYVLGWGSAACRVDRGSIEYDSAIGARIVQNKATTATMLRDAGLPAPVHHLVRSDKDALRAAHALGWPVVVKPADRDRGEGVTVDVDSDEKVALAFAHAGTFSKRILVERQVEGICHRICVARDKLIIVSRRMPKSVRGDGEHTVQQIVDEANAIELAKPPWVRLKPFPLDEDALACLHAVGLSPGKVPAANEFVPLRRIQSSQQGGVVELFTDTIHPDNVDVAIRSARLFGLSLAGVDMISPDITRPWHENGAILNEVNYSSLLPGRQTIEPMIVLLRQFIPRDGRIPVELVVGEGQAAIEAGERLRAAQVARGLRCCLASEDRSVGADGRPLQFGGKGLFARCIALILDSNVDAMVVVARSDELLQTGLPVDRITRITVVPGAKAAWVEPLRALAAPYVAAESM